MKTEKEIKKLYDSLVNYLTTHKILDNGLGITEKEERDITSSINTLKWVLEIKK